MNNRSVMVFSMVLISVYVFSANLSIAQQADKEIAKNQAEQVDLELEMVNNDLMSADYDAEEGYLNEQSQAQKDADIAQQQLDSEAESLLEQARQEDAQRTDEMNREEQSHIKRAMQESDQQAAEIEEIDQRIKADLSNQE